MPRGTEDIQRQAFRSRRIVGGLAFAYTELGDMEPAQKYFQAVLEMEAPKELRSLARNGQREIAFEIGMLGQYGLDINDPQESHVLRALPGRVLSALQLICIMYAGFKRIEPGMDIGVELGEEWGMAERLRGEVEKGP